MTSKRRKAEAAAASAELAPATVGKRRRQEQLRATIATGERNAGVMEAAGQVIQPARLRARLEGYREELRSL